METFTENKSKYVAFTFTMSVHALLFFILVFVVFVKPHPVEKPVLNASDGYLSLGVFEPTVTDQSVKSNSSSVISSTNIISDPTESNITVNNAARSENETSEELRTALIRMHSIKNEKGGGVNTEGTKTQSVGPNITNGTPDIGEATGAYLKDRILIGKPEVILNSSEEGKIVVEILVDENGKVVRAIPGQRGSTTTNAILFEKAMRAALTAKFNPSIDGIKEQRGTYTFIFNLE